MVVHQSIPFHWHSTCNTKEQIDIFHIGLWKNSQCIRKQLELKFSLMLEYLLLKMLLKFVLKKAQTFWLRRKLCNTRYSVLYIFFTIVPFIYLKVYYITKKCCYLISNNNLMIWKCNLICCRVESNDRCFLVSFLVLIVATKAIC